MQFCWQWQCSVSLPLPPLPGTLVLCGTSSETSRHYWTSFTNHLIPGGGGGGEWAMHVAKACILSLWMKNLWKTCARAFIPNLCFLFSSERFVHGCLSKNLVSSSETFVKELCKNIYPEFAVPVFEWKDGARTLFRMRASEWLVLNDLCRYAWRDFNVAGMKDLPFYRTCECCMHAWHFEV